MRKLSDVMNGLSEADRREVEFEYQTLRKTIPLLGLREDAGTMWVMPKQMALQLCDAYEALRASFAHLQDFKRLADERCEMLSAKVEGLEKTEGGEVSDRTCGNCMLPIQPNEPGIRHYGFYAAHAEYRCYALLRERAERAETELARVTAERDQYRLERDQRGAELEALSRRIAEAPIATVKHYDYFGEWALLKEASMTIFEPLKGHRVALVRIDGDKA